MLDEYCPVTGLVLLVYVTDLALRAFTFRRMLLRRGWAWFDFIVVTVSVVLFFVSLGAEAAEHTSSSRGVSTGLRSLLVALRWLRALRAAAMLAKTGRAGRAAACVQLRRR